MPTTQEDMTWYFILNKKSKQKEQTARIIEPLKKSFMEEFIHSLIIKHLLRARYCSRPGVIAMNETKQTTPCPCGFYTVVVRETNKIHSVLNGNKCSWENKAGKRNGGLYF